MKLFENIKEFFFSADDDYDYGDDFMDTPVKKEESKISPARTASSTPRTSHSEFGGGKREDKHLNIQAVTQLQVVVVKPEVFSDAKAIADHLTAKKTVVLNLETASPDNKRRIIDFLVGVAYALKSKLKPVANLTYIITPENVGVAGEELVGELENSGVLL